MQFCKEEVHTEKLTFETQYQQLLQINQIQGESQQTEEKHLKTGQKTKLQDSVLSIFKEEINCSPINQCDIIQYNTY